MAKSRRTNTGLAPDIQAPPARRNRGASVTTCPVCSARLGDVPAAMHLQEHEPTVKCIMCPRDDKRWRLDWDNVIYHPTWSLWFCSNCGRFAPREEVIS